MWKLKAYTIDFLVLSKKIAHLWLRQLRGTYSKVCGNIYEICPLGIYLSPCVGYMRGIALQMYIWKLGKGDVAGGEKKKVRFKVASFTQTVQRKIRFSQSGLHMDSTVLV